MEEVDLLKQKLEFMQMELDDYKQRETQQKSMYESMLKSYSCNTAQNTSSSTIEIKSLKEEHSLEILKITSDFKEKMFLLEAELEKSKENSKNLESKLDQEISKNQDLKSFSEHNHIIFEEYKKDIETKYNELHSNFTYTVTKKDEENNILRDEINKLKKESTEELSKLTEDTNKSILELRAIYSQDRPKKSIEGGEAHDLKIEFQKMQRIIKKLESSEKKLKEQIKVRDDFIEKINKKLRIQASEDKKDWEMANLIKSKETLTEKLIDKEVEISRLKQEIGDLKLEISGVNKPPIYSPRVNRSATLFNKFEQIPSDSHLLGKQEYNSLKQCEKMIESAKSLVCEKCFKTFNKTVFYDHISNCQVSENCNPERNSLESTQEIDKQVEVTKLALKKMKVQKDKAKIEAEKILMQLIQVKLDWALSEEQFNINIMNLKKELKNCFEILQRVRRTVSLSSDISFEIDLLIHNIDRFFGGRFCKSLIENLED